MAFLFGFRMCYDLENPDHLLLVFFEANWSLKGSNPISLFRWPGTQLLWWVMSSVL